ncbi:MAG: acyl-CoA dehydrogenase [Candidatus Cloacimonetes bacterium 4572_55]|nr:MAG: acyl-CoA dehydrogenase [Candidatus Cloacimonetes bacterium 4572_55]
MTTQPDFRLFVDKEIMPHSDQFDREERIPPELIKTLFDKGYIAGFISPEYGGAGMDMTTYGLLCEQIGRGNASLLSLFTVHGMVSYVLLKWGTKEQNTRWLPRLASGEIISAFGLTEPNIGTDARHIETEARATEKGYILNGKKKWTSFGQIADLFLILALCEGKPAAFFVPRETEGFSIKPMSGLLGFRSAQLAELQFENCLIPKGNLVGRIGFGFSHIAGTALDHGRFCIGWGCTGLAQACLDASLKYSSERKQFGSFLKEHQLIQRFIADMVVRVKAARLLCQRAAELQESGDPELIMETSIAKYFASTAAMQSALDAVQIHGANGCCDQYPVQRYLRDAKIMEIIEGSSQIQQIIISRYAHQFELI